MKTKYRYIVIKINDKLIFFLSWYIWAIQIDVEWLLHVIAFIIIIVEMYTEKKRKKKITGKIVSVLRIWICEFIWLNVTREEVKSSMKIMDIFAPATESSRILTELMAFRIKLKCNVATQPNKKNETKWRNKRSFFVLFCRFVTNVCVHIKKHLYICVVISLLIDIPKNKTKITRWLHSKRG